MIPHTRLIPHLRVRPVHAPAQRARAASSVPARAVVKSQLSHHPAIADAIHAAFQVARREDTLFALVAMVPVGHPGWLGTALGESALPQSIERLQRQALVTAEDYGVLCALTRYQYTTWAEGTAQAAELWGATTLVSARPRRTLPGWTHVEAWMLRHQLARQGCFWQEAPFPHTR